MSTELVAMAHKLLQMAETGASDSTAIECMQAERDEVGKYLTKRVAFLEEENFQLYKRLKDEFSQHARYNKFKDEVESYMGAKDDPKKEEEFKKMKKRARDEAAPDFQSFLTQQRACLDERKATAVVLKEEHEMRIKRIREEAAKKDEHRRRAATAGVKNPSLTAFSALTQKGGGRKKDAPKEKKETKTRPKTAPQIYNFEEATKAAYFKAKEASGQGKEFPTLVAWGNAKYDELPREAKDRYCLLYTSPSPRDATLSRMPSSA